MAAARQKAFSSSSRNAAYASISVNFKKMFPDADRQDRLDWIGEYLGYIGTHTLDSMSSLTDEQLGAVAGEMKRLTGTSGQQSAFSGQQKPIGSNVVQGDFGKASSGDGDGETVFLSSPEMVYTLEKLIAYIGWSADHMTTFFRARFDTDKLRMLTFPKARKAVNALLHIAAHRDLKKQKGGDTPVSRAETTRYIPALKRKLQIDQ